MYALPSDFDGVYSKVRAVDVMLIPEGGRHKAKRSGEERRITLFSSRTRGNGASSC